MDGIAGHDVVRALAEPPLVDDATELLAAVTLGRALGPLRHCFRPTSMQPIPSTQLCGPAI
jgi:hypothetical protein